MTTASTVSVSSARPVTGSVLEDFIEKATAGLDANPAQLREKILPLLKADTTPEEALKHLISLSVSLTSAQTPDWKYAAGRLAGVQRGNRLSDDLCRFVCRHRHDFRRRRRLDDF